MSYELHEDSIVVRHTEAVTDVLQSLASNGGFSLNMYNLNPGLPLNEGGTFPLLSGIAGNFQKYRWRKAKFFYKTQSGTDTRGLVMISFSYENDASPPSSSIILRSMSGTVQGPPRAQSLVSNLDCKSFHSGEPYALVRVSDIPDLDEYDNGFLIVATQGCTPSDTEPLGSLWVEYEVELCKPRALDDIVYQRGAQTSLTPTGTINLAPGSVFNLMRTGDRAVDQIPGLKAHVDATAPAGGSHYITVDKDMEALLSYNVPVEASTRTGSTTGQTETKIQGDISFEYGPDVPASLPDVIDSTASQGVSFVSSHLPAAFRQVGYASLSGVAVILLKGYRYYCTMKNSSSSVNNLMSAGNVAEKSTFLFTFMRLLSPLTSLQLAVQRARRGERIPDHLSVLAPVQQAQLEYLETKAPERKLGDISELESDAGSEDVDFCEPRPHLHLDLDDDRSRRRRNALKKLSVRVEQR